MKILVLGFLLPIITQSADLGTTHSWQTDKNNFLRCYEIHWNGNTYIRMNGGNPITDESKCESKKQLIESRYLVYAWEDDGNHYLKCYEKFWNGNDYVRMNGGKPTDESKCESKKQLIESRHLVYAWEDDGKHYLKCYEKFWNGNDYVRMNGGKPTSCEIIPEIKKNGAEFQKEKSKHIDDSNRNAYKPRGESKGPGLVEKASSISK